MVTLGCGCRVALLVQPMVHPAPTALPILELCLSELPAQLCPVSGSVLWCWGRLC